MRKQASVNRQLQFLLKTLVSESASPWAPIQGSSKAATALMGTLEARLPALIFLFFRGFVCREAVQRRRMEKIARLRYAQSMKSIILTDDRYGTQ